MGANNMVNFAKRYSEDRGWIREETPGHVHSWFIDYGLQGDEMIAAFFWESVYTALTHADPLIVFRTCIQVHEYQERLKGTIWSTAFDGDYAAECRNRFEDMLKTMRDERH